MRIVLDTNVVVSALIWGGRPLRLLELAVEGSVTLCTSPVLIQELADVLGRSHLAPRLAAKGSSVQQALQEYSELSLVFTPEVVPTTVPTDPDDDHVVAAAFAAKADAVISGDSDLLALCRYGEIVIWTVVEAIEWIEVANAPG